LNSFARFAAIQKLVAVGFVIESIIRQNALATRVDTEEYVQETFTVFLRRLCLSLVQLLATQVNELALDIASAGYEQRQQH
jgi:hypothetical protein